MTVLTTSSSKTYLGDGANKDFATGFRFLADADLTVKLTHGGVQSTLVQGVDYDLSGADAQAGGTVEMTTAPAVGDTLYIERNTTILQETDLRVEGQFLADDIEEMFDRRCMVEQELARRIAVLEAAGANVTVTNLLGSKVQVDFTTHVNAVENTFPFNVACTSGSVATDAWATYLENRDNAAEVFDEPPAIQWGPGVGNNVILKRVSGLKPGTNYRLRIFVIHP